MKTGPVFPPLDGLLSTLGGWLGGVALLFTLDVIQQPRAALDWLAVDVFGSLLFIPMLFAFWGLLWWLLTVVPSPSRLWHPLLCVPMGATVGSGLLYLYGRAGRLLFPPGPDSSSFDPFFNFGVLVGATALGTLCLIKRFRR